MQTGLFRLYLFVTLAILGVRLSVAQIAPPTANSLQSGSSSAGSTNSLIAIPQDFPKLKLAPGFMLAITVYDAPELSGSFRVDRSGDLTLPLAGSVHVAGLTSLEAQERLNELFVSREILNHPQVTVNIVEYAPFIVSVLGEVAKPGQVPLLAPRSLLNILTDVGGPTELAGHVVEVKHTVDGLSRLDTYRYARGEDGSAIRDVIVDDGDTVTIPRAGIVYVMGAVTRPGGYVMQEAGDLNVAQALSLALGTTRDAQVGAIRVVRRKADGTTVDVPVNYKAISNGKQVPAPLLAQDIVYVPVSKLKTLFSSSAGIVGSTASTAIILAK
jgi:polysaccharide export outer membrane protein